MDKKKPTIDLSYFKEYVDTYNESQYQSNETFIRDMIYGIGLAVDGENYKMADGYQRFVLFLLSEILKDDFDKRVKNTLRSSELIRMAQKHFDEESTEEMIQELREELLNTVK